ncbi:unnamed protein product [Vitrella brassicaformis CCMP3155]|uniref:Uncharacterized protein n=1 Tax=Vitrella brassicaformis (strain CCMP3155) TaxID=1169540 RepID=A0A0G4EQI6_VITBC|nr:unnamed protein product [Vitrella brassicaformis CCMP3155]|eukprot:CEL99731.1 unnamed protein product [Vitrella brassicaformis CCMP3155]
MACLCCRPVEKDRLETERAEYETKDAMRSRVIDDLTRHFLRYVQEAERDISRLRKQIDERDGCATEQVDLQARLEKSQMKNDLLIMELNVYREELLALKRLNPPEIIVTPAREPWPTATPTSPWTFDPSEPEDDGDVAIPPELWEPVEPPPASLQRRPGPPAPPAAPSSIPTPPPEQLPPPPQHLDARIASVQPPVPSSHGRIRRRRYRLHPTTACTTTAAIGHK